MSVIQLHAPRFDTTISTTELDNGLGAQACSPVRAILDKATHSRDTARAAGSLTAAGRRHRATAAAYLDAATMAAGKPQAAAELHRLLFTGLSGARALESALEEFDTFAS